MDTFREFISQYPSQTYKKGETILLKGDKPQSLYIIESGQAKAYSITNSGNERLVAIHSKGDGFPIGFGFGLIEKTQYFYEAFSKCIVRLVPREKYLDHLHNNIESLYHRQEKTTALLLSTLSRVDALEQASAGEKVARTLLFMADQLGDILRSTDEHQNVSVTQQEIANSLGLARETVNIELKKLQALELINYSKKRYTVYSKKLQSYLEDK
jgi:CRP-like cAMP-binding protein